MVMPPASAGYSNLPANAHRLLTSSRQFVTCPPQASARNLSVKSALPCTAYSFFVPARRQILKLILIGDASMAAPVLLCYVLLLLLPPPHHVARTCSHYHPPPTTAATSSLTILAGSNNNSTTFASHSSTFSAVPPCKYPLPTRCQVHQRLCQHLRAEDLARRIRTHYQLQRGTGVQHLPQAEGVRMAESMAKRRDSCAIVPVYCRGCFENVYGQAHQRDPAPD